MHQACVLQLPICLDATELQMHHSLKNQVTDPLNLTSHTPDTPILQPREIIHLTDCNQTVIP